MGLSMQERLRVIAETAVWYRAATKLEKGRILDELTALTGYNRKYALHEEYAITDTLRAELTTNHYKTNIPVRTFYGSDEQPPGYLEIDTVFHSGPSLEHKFCCTLNATDTMTGWVELRALPNRAQR